MQMQQMGMMGMGGMGPPPPMGMGMMNMQGYAPFIAPTSHGYPGMMGGYPPPVSWATKENGTETDRILTSWEINSVLVLRPSILLI